VGVALASPAATLDIENFSGGTLKELGWEGGNLDDGKADFTLVSEGKEIKWDATRYPILKWRWRVHRFPKAAKVLDPKRSDAPAQVYVVWRDFPIYYVIKYFWSTDDAPGAQLEQTSLFAGRLWGVILRSGGAADQWQSEQRNLLQDFRDAFKRQPPGMVRGLAVLSDGDETKSESQADYDDFVVASEEKTG
jgi:hypothetical protein